MKLQGSAMSRFVDALIEDSLSAMSHTRTRLCDALIQGKDGPDERKNALTLYHGTRGNWARGIQVMPMKVPVVCERSSYCRAAGGSLGHGQYFSSSAASAREWAQGPESDRAGPGTPLYALKLNLASTCADGTPVADLVGVRFPGPLSFGCHFCPRAVQARWRSRIQNVLVQAGTGANAIDFVFLQPSDAVPHDLEVAFTVHGLSRGLPVTAIRLQGKA